MFQPGLVKIEPFNAQSKIFMQNDSCRKQLFPKTFSAQAARADDEWASTFASLLGGVRGQFDEPPRDSLLLRWVSEK